MYESDYGYNVVFRFTYKGNSRFVIQIDGKWILESRDGTKQHFHSIEEFYEKATLDGLPLADAWGDVKKL